MLAATDPSIIVGEFAAAGIGVYLLWRLIVWVRDSPTRPDPWEPEVAEKLADPETPEVCPRCSTPQPPTAWFCEHCGRAVGPYNNMMPFLQIFSEGEVFRNGTDNHYRKRPMILMGYILLGFGIIPWFFAPVYWFSLLKNLKHPQNADQSVVDEKS